MMLQKNGCKTHARSAARSSGAAAAVLPGCSRMMMSFHFHQPTHRSRVAARAQEDPDKDLESLFSKELKRRGLDSIDDLGGWPGPSDEGAQSSSTSTSKSPFQSATQTTPRTKAAGAEQGGDQRQRSIALVNEGLEGLIPRATELLKLGGSVFLAFAPFILAISVLFGGIYLTFGDHFVHGGDRSSGPPAYVDPNQLLSEPTVDPYIPYQ